jgi:hypothetical protein
MRQTFASRRRFLRQIALVGAATLAAKHASFALAHTASLVANSEGNYRFLPAGEVFNSGALPDEGYEIVHALFSPWLPLARGYEAIENYLKSIDRPIQALCGMELRVPKQFSFEGFREFNIPYIEQLRKWELVFDKFSAVSRTNVAPALDAPSQPVVHAFSFTAPATGKGKTFVVSGTADIDQGKIVAGSDVSLAGMKRRLEYVVEIIGKRLEQLGLDWSAATHIDLCYAQNIGGMLGSLLVPELKGAAARGLRTHFARPPIVGSEVELEARGVNREIVLV